MRLQKFLAECGVASRRKSEEYIEQGLVTVNGEKITQMGFQVDESKDIVKFKGKRVKPEEKKVYIMLNKPAGCVCTCHDDKGRDTVLKYVKGVKERLYPVGRLDFTTEGLLILTNDGELANKLTHPRHGVQKKYLAVIEGNITDEELDKLEKGVNIGGYKTQKAVFHLLSRSAVRSEVLCVIAEGKNRQIRRMFECVEKNVKYLKRVAVGDLKLSNLKKGAFRHLEESEIKYLKSIADK